MAKPTHRDITEGAVEFKPSQYMRATYPELYSDTLPLDSPALDKGRLEYHLETLTSRKQEQEFEEFCRRLVELEICPNLKPQTGATGGGDSKVDASTYPVSRALSERCWWWGAVPPGDENWAFAFSCQKTWKKKAKDDFEKIANLDRDYSRVYFITSQFARDKDRGFLESELSKKHKFEAHILDRSWIVSRVIEHKREHIAIEELGIGGASLATPMCGPRDAGRQRALNELLESVRDPGRYFGNDYALAQDYGRAAILARGLEKTRHEVDGLFERALTLAEKFGHKGQILRVGYDWAWTTFWWYDDAFKHEQIYSRIERCIDGTLSSEECGMLSRQWKLLRGAVLHGYIDEGSARLDQRLNCIKSELARLEADKTRPNNALQARTERLVLDLVLAFDDPAQAESILEEMGRCIKESENLGTYPAMDIINFVSNFGKFIGEFPGYDALLDQVCLVSRKRISELDEGRILFKRGIQFAEYDRHEQVLKYIGKARSLLFKEEAMREGIRATLICADAYSSLGLYWAARMEALTAAHATTCSTEAFNEFPLEGLYACKKMAWLELKLGRVCPFLAWYQIASALVVNLASMQYAVEADSESLLNQQFVLGQLFLRMDSDSIRTYEGLKSTLGDRGLPASRCALLYALGDIATLKDEWKDEESYWGQDIDGYFAKWREQPESGLAQTQALGANTEYLELCSELFGVNYRIKCRNDLGTIVIAENILGVLEATMSIAKWENLAFIVHECCVLVDAHEEGTNPPRIELQEVQSAQELKSIWAPEFLDWMNKGERTRVREYFEQFLITILLASTIDSPEDIESEIKRWMGEDARTRAFGTTPISIALVDMIGDMKYDLAYWCKATTPPPIR